MPVPVNVTVTSSLVAPESVAVKVKSEPFSATELALVLKVTVGAVSLSVIVIVSDCVPLSVASPPDTPVMAMIAVSLPS